MGSLRWLRPFLTAGGVLVALAVGSWLFLPWPLFLRTRNPQTTSFILYRQAQARKEGRDLTVRKEWAPLEEISPNLRRAVIVAEDHRFRSHHGIDWQALAEETHYRGDTASFSLLSPGDLRSLAQAVRYGAEHRHEVKGRSTITQQLAKNLYFTPERSLARKAMEAVVAQRLEWFLDKDRILELYLNVAEWGPGIFGAEAASQVYFGVSASALTLSQAAALAATLPHPLTSNPRYRPGRMAWRQALILDRLLGGRTPVPPPEIEIAAPAPTAPVLPSLSEPGPTPPPPDTSHDQGAGRSSNQRPQAW